MKRYTVFIAKLTTAIGVLIIIWLIIRGFFYDDFINTKTTVDLPTAGTFGDFIGGFVGTIFALVGIFLLYATLQVQRQELTDSRKVFVKQQFDNTFFELIKLFNQIFTDIKVETDDGIKVQKELFDFEMKSMQEEFVPKRTFAQNRNLAIELYQKFYVKYLKLTSVYFKTLYRIYNLIDKSDISDKDKIEYAKILRAQLTDSELFMIRYNAMTENGRASIEYINKYNILKHLSNFELLEFKDWWKDLDSNEKNGLGYLFMELKEVLTLLIDETKFDQLHRKFKNGRYDLTIKSKQPSEFEIILTIDSTKNSKKSAISDGFDKFTHKQIECLIEGIVKELIIVSNFNKYNYRKELHFDSDTNTINNQTIIKVSVKNKMNKPLKISYKFD